MDKRVTVDSRAVNYVRIHRTATVVSVVNIDGPSTSYVNSTIDLPWRNFLSSRVCDKVAERSILIFFGVPEFPYNSVHAHVG